MADPTPSDYESQDRLALLKGAISGTLAPPPEPDLDPSDPATLVPLARQTLAEVMGDHSAKPAERTAAADSILDRYAEPRRKFEMGGSKTVNIQLPAEAMTNALGALSQIFKSSKGDTLDVPFALPPVPILAPVHQPGPTPGSPPLGWESEGVTRGTEK